ncbi:hypothetical protein CRX42_01095 [Pseudomonas jessenii]|uniref:MFS transporter n=1 Tax=Pseudomonas jessenii TaxID=77298 RepID=A0A2W0EY54_PSEJE|nr:MFS transporter [Pseudomonas jessenii]PYY72472.1 hypothetical protein CRX42_01095 [Pseudomonas jessenii]
MSAQLRDGVTSKYKNLLEMVVVGLLFVAGNMSNAIYPSFVNALTNIPVMQSVSIGNLATAEFLAFGLAVLLAGRVVPANKLRLTAGICLFTHLLTAYAMTVLPLSALIGCRLLYGAASGTLVWIAYSYLARTSLPGQLVGIYLTGLMITGVLWSVLAPDVIVPLFGYPSLFLFLTSISFLALIFLRFCPKQINSLSESSEQSKLLKNKLSLPPILILCSVGCWGFFMTIFWVYSDPIAQTLSGELLKHWLTISLVCQIFGAALSAWLVERMPTVPVLSIGLLISVLQVASIIAGVGGTVFVVWTGVYGFLGYFLVAFYIKALANTDSTNRSVAYFPGVQMLIASIGPMVVSQMVAETDLTAVLTIDLVAIIIAPLFLWAAIVIYKRSVSRSRSSKVRMSGI